MPTPSPMDCPHCGGCSPTATHDARCPAITGIYSKKLAVERGLCSTPSGSEIIPTPEQATWLTNRGWLPEEAKVLGERIYSMWSSPDKQMRASFSLAWSIAHNEEDHAKRTQIVQEGRDIFCNKCGKNMKVESNGSFVGYYGLVHASFSTGYWSNGLPDCHRYIFNLCEGCIKELMEKFQIPPITEFTL